MITKEELCRKIEEIIPEAGVCDIDFNVEFDEESKAWAVDMHHGVHHLKTFLDVEEANNCVEGKMCIPLGMQIAQLKKNFDLPSCAD